MELTLDFDRGEMAKYGAEIKALAAATHRTATDVIRDDLKELVTEVIATTPPFGRHATLQSLESQFWPGRGAVRRDVRRVFRPVQSLRVWKQPIKARVKRALEKAVRNGDTETVAKILKFHPGRVIPRAEPALHQAARDERGHVAADFKWFVVLDETSVRDYEKEQIEHVGRAKAGWETAANGLGLGLPEWIERHTTPGRFEDRSGDANEPSFVIGNGVEYGSHFDELHILESAMARAEKRLGKKLDEALSELSNDD